MKKVVFIISLFTLLIGTSAKTQEKQFKDDEITSAWNKTLKINNVKAYMDFINKYPYADQLYLAFSKLLKLNSGILKWNDEFLEKQYIGNTQLISDALDDAIHSMFPFSMAYSRQTVDNGIIRGNLCSTDGSSTIGPENRIIIFYKYVNIKNGILIGFKSDPENEEILVKLHAKLFKYIKTK